MPETSVKKVGSQQSPQGPMGQRDPVMGERMSMRPWEEEPGDEKQTPSRGGLRVVRSGASRHDQILGSLPAVVATSSPAEVHGRHER